MIDLGAGTDTKGHMMYFIYKLDNTGKIVLDVTYGFRYVDTDFTYFKRVNGTEEIISYSDYVSNMTSNGYYGEFNVDFFTLTAGCTTIDEAFAILESRIK